MLINFKHTSFSKLEISSILYLCHYFWSEKFFGNSPFCRYSEITWSNRGFVISQLSQIETKISQFYTKFKNANLRKILFSGNPKMSSCEFFGIRLWWWLASILLQKGLTDPIFFICLSKSWFRGSIRVLFGHRLYFGTVCF